MKQNADMASEEQVMTVDKPKRPLFIKMFKSLQERSPQRNLHMLIKQQKKNKHACSSKSTLMIAGQELCLTVKQA